MYIRMYVCLRDNGSIYVYTHTHTHTHTHTGAPALEPARVNSGNPQMMLWDTTNSKEQW